MLFSIDVDKVKSPVLSLSPAKPNPLCVDVCVCEISFVSILLSCVDYDCKFSKIMLKASMRSAIVSNYRVSSQSSC